MWRPFHSDLPLYRFSVFTIRVKWPAETPSSSQPPTADRPPLLFPESYPCLCVYIFVPPQVLPNAANTPPVAVLSSPLHHAPLSHPPPPLRLAPPPSQHS